MAWGRISPNGHSTCTCESVEWNATLKMLSAARGIMQRIVCRLQAKEGCIPTASIPPSFGLEISRNVRLEGNSPLPIRMLCVQETDKMHEPQNNIQRLMILTPLCPPSQISAQESRRKKKEYVECLEKK